MIEFSQHAIDKIAIYGISKSDVQQAMEQPILSCQDLRENSTVLIIAIEKTLFAVVISATTNNIVTVYRTDDKTIQNRRRKERWICKSIL